MVNSAFPGTPTSAIEALLPFPPHPLYLKGQALLVKHRLQKTGRLDEVGMGGRMSLESHVRELCKAGLNISELHKLADSVPPLQFNPLSFNFYTAEQNLLESELLCRWFEAERTARVRLRSILP